MTVSFRLAAYSLSASSCLRLLLACRCRSRSAMRLCTALSKRFRSSALAFEALPGVLPANGIVLDMTDAPLVALVGRSKSARRACKLAARSAGLTVTRSPADDAPFPGGGRRARADDAKEDEVAGRVGLIGTVSGRRMGLPAREAVWDTNALLGRVRGTNPAGSRRLVRGVGRYKIVEEEDSVCLFIVS